jgi:hypothetical protein
MNSVHATSLPFCAADYLRKARTLLQLAGSADDIETRRLIQDRAAVNLAAYRSMTGGRA